MKNLMKKLHTKTMTLLIGTTLLFNSFIPSCLSEEIPEIEPRITAKNIVLMIGDGMGEEHINATSIFLTGEKGNLYFESFPYHSKVSTFSANNVVTDSPAATTAIACGVKVNNGIISKEIPGSGKNLETILEYCKKIGKSTGLVTTSYITDATPAGFGAHSKDRYNAGEIINGYLNQSRPNILYGGGGRVNKAVFESAGYNIINNKIEMEEIKDDLNLHIFGSFGEFNMPYEYDGLNELPHLSEMTYSALKILNKDPEGYFLMIEGGRIDHASHYNDIIRTIYETVEFNNATKIVDEYCNKEETLIIATADHETGGLNVIRNNGESNIPTVTWSSTWHTSKKVDVYSTGIGSENVTGITDNTEIYNVMRQAITIKTEVKNWREYE